MVAAVGRKLLFRHYSVVQAREGGAAKPKLAEMGPSLDLSLRRMREPPAELEMQALKQPKLVKNKVSGDLTKHVDFGSSLKAAASSTSLLSACMLCGGGASRLF